jgi:hypothetical protein
MSSEQNLSNIIVVGLLRSLLQTFPGSPPTGVDLKQEWMSAISLFKESYLEEFYHYDQVCKCDTCDDYTHEAESHRHKLIVAHYICKTLNLLLRMFKKNDTLQYLYLSILLADANAIIVLLKFLSQDFSNYVTEVESNIISDQIDLKALLSQTICESVQLIRRILKFNKEKLVSHFIEYKGPLLIKRLYNTISDSNVRDLSLKLMRSLIKFLPKTWKTYPSNLKFISAIYLTLNPKDNDWISGTVTEYIPHEELKQLCKLYNSHHYLTSKKRMSISEEDLSDEFKENYEQWLEENVWGVTFSNL